MPRAYADVPVSRQALHDPAFRREVRMRLYRQLTTLGAVVSEVTYGRDPTDGPLVEQGYPTDEVAIVRASADVIPNRDDRIRKRY